MNDYSDLFIFGTLARTTVSRLPGRGLLFVFSSLPFFRKTCILLFVSTTWDPGLNTRRIETLIGSKFHQILQNCNLLSDFIRNWGCGWIHARTTVSRLPDRDLFVQHHFKNKTLLFVFLLNKLSNFGPIIPIMGKNGILDPIAFWLVP